MKTLLLFSVLFICLPAVISSQNHKERIRDPFERIHKGTRPEQMFGNVQTRGVEFPGIHLNKNANKPGSVFYQPIKVTCDDTLRETYTYNNSGNMLTELYEIWSNNTWVNNYRNTYTYNNSGNMLTGLLENWWNNAWLNSKRGTFTYDNSGNLLTEFFELWYNTWVSFAKYSYTYDNSGNMLTELYEIQSNNTWVNNYRNTYTYDNSSNMLTWLSENGINNAWVNDLRHTYTFNNSGNMLTEIVESWSNNAWLNSQRGTYTYDNSGNLLTWLFENWGNNAWVIFARNIYTYDNSGNMLTELFEIGSNNTWVNNNRYTYTYDNNGNCIHGEYSSWQNGAWIPSMGFFTLSYNHHENFLYPPQAAVVDVEYASFTGVARENTDVNSFNLYQNYPNPFNPSTTIQYSVAERSAVTLKVYDMLGREAAQLVNGSKDAGSYEVNLDASKLVSGLYVYTLRAGSYSVSKKMLLIK